MHTGFLQPPAQDTCPHWPLLPCVESGWKNRFPETLRPVLPDHGYVLIDVLALLDEAGQGRPVVR